MKMHSDNPFQQIYDKCEVILEYRNIMRDHPAVKWEVEWIMKKAQDALNAAASQAGEGDCSNKSLRDLAKEIEDMFPNIQMGLMTLQQIEGILKVAYNKGVMAVECDREAAFRSDFPPPCPEVTPSPQASAPSPIVVTEHGERLFKQGEKPNQIILQDGMTVTIEPWSSPTKPSAPESPANIETRKEGDVKMDDYGPQKNLTRPENNPVSRGVESPALEALIDAYLRFVPTDRYKECGGFKLVLEARAEATELIQRAEDNIPLVHGSVREAARELLGTVYRTKTNPPNEYPEIGAVEVMNAVRVVENLIAENNCLLEQRKNWATRRTLPVDVRKCAEEIQKATFRLHETVPGMTLSVPALEAIISSHLSGDSGKTREGEGR